VPHSAADKHWVAMLVALVGVRLGIPFAALAASGERIPGLPSYTYRPLNGDAFGFLDAVRGLYAAVPRVHPAVLALLALVVVAAVLAAVRLWSTRPAQRWLWVLLPAGALSTAVAVVISEMDPPGAAVIGWSLVWAVPLAPVRAVAGSIDPDAAFVAGLALSLAAVAATVVATAYAGLYATGRRSVGIAAAALFAVWPLVTRPLAGQGAWENGQWNIDVGLHLYSEPLSTCLVAAAIALVLRPVSGPLGLAVAGLLLGYATVVKLSDGVVAVALVAVLAVSRGVRIAVPVALGGAVSIPLVAAYWPKGYVAMFDGATAAVDRPWAIDYASRNWSDSLLFTPALIAVLLPLAAVGVAALPSWYVRATLLLPVAVTALLYSFYYVTFLHPRFLYVTLPPLFVLEAAGGAAVVDALRHARRRHALE
jgi:hypothetical protein